MIDSEVSVVAWCKKCGTGDVSSVNKPSPDEQCDCGEVRDMFTMCMADPGRRSRDDAVLTIRYGKYGFEGSFQFSDLELDSVKAPVGKIIQDCYDKLKYEVERAYIERGKKDADN